MYNKSKFYSRNVLWRLLLALILVVVVLVWQREFLYEIYLRDQLTPVGIVVNGGILLLFISGVLRLLSLFARYVAEEKFVNRFVVNIQRDLEPAEGIAEESMILQRYKMLNEMHTRRARINQSALAASVVAFESSQLSFPKFVNNVLILTGVFGTIVSLSISLLGASDMLGAATEIGGLGTVIHGMSTALSTTMTAILCYFFFGYFYLKLTDTQTHIISRIEQITATTLMPRFQVESDTVLQNFGDMVRTATSLTSSIADSQERMNEAAQMLKGLVGDTQKRLTDVDRRFEQLIELLRAGFRLPPDNRQ